TAGSNGWELAVELERLLGRRVPLFGISLALNLPRVLGGYPYEEDILERLARSKLRRLLAALPGSVRGRVIERVPRELTAAAVFGGTPSAAHSEALLRAIEFKGTRLDAPAARQLGFVPVHGISAALGMARAAGAERIGYLLSPPYFPLLVGGRLDSAG